MVLTISENRTEFVVLALGWKEREKCRFSSFLPLCLTFALF